MQEKLQTGELEVPKELTKSLVLKLQQNYERIIKRFIENDEKNKNWIFFNSFIFFHNIRFESIYKFTEKCGMSLAELSAITTYTGGLYKYINRSLRSDVQVNSLKNLTSIFNNGLDKLESYTGKVIRGSNLSEPYLSQHALNAIVRYKGLTSTSIGVPFKAEYSFIIESKTGKDISLISMFPDEKEVLFKPNTHFLIKNKTGSQFEMTELN